MVLLGKASLRRGHLDHDLGEEGQVFSGESVPVTGSSRCEGPEVGMCLVCLRK